MSAVPSRYHSPAVQYPAVRSAWLAAILGALSLAGLLTLGAWAVLGASAHPWPLIGGCFLLWLLVTLVTWRCWARLPTGLLAWDGLAWELLPAGASGLRGALTVHLDLQYRLAVCLHPVGARPLWIWLERRSAPHRWGDLRRAVYSRRGTGATDAALPAQQPAGTL